MPTAWGWRRPGKAGKMAWPRCGEAPKAASDSEALASRDSPNVGRSPVGFTSEAFAAKTRQPKCSPVGGNWRSLRRKSVCFHGFLWSSPSTCLPICLRPGGRFLIVWLRRRRRPRDTVQIVVFVGGPLFKTFVSLGKKTVFFIPKDCQFSACQV